MLNMDSDGFIPVKYSKRKKKINLPMLSIINSHNSENMYDSSINYTRDAALRKIKFALNEVNSSDYFATFWKELDQTVSGDLSKSLSDISQIVCYGLGSLCRTTKSIEQFALLVNVQQKLKIPIEFYDPVFTDTDKSIITKDFNYQVLGINEEGRRTADDLTMFYLPHCPHLLSNNLIFANWDPGNLKNCIIISNGFSKVLDNTPNSKIPPFNYIRRAKPFTKELNLNNSFVPMDVFNDFSIHVFPLQAYETTSTDDTIWNKSELPSEEANEENPSGYGDSEMIRRQINCPFNSV